MDRNRPQGREKHVTENGTGVYKKDQVHTSGPVGSGHGPGTSDLGTGSSESSGRKSGVRSVTRSPISIILILAIGCFPNRGAKIDNVHQTNGRLKYSLIQPTII